MAGMPHLVQMDRKYKKKGLQIIGVHRQNATDEQLQKIAKDYKIGFPIAKTGSDPTGGRGIPRMHIFNGDGKLVFSGHPTQAEDVIKKELRKIKAPASTSSSSIFDKPKDLIPLRTWTNADGKKMKASLISVADGKGSFKFADGRKFDYVIDNLSEADQKLIAEKTAE